MNNDFHKLYRGYSNAALINILQNPEQYPAAAVDAANEILEERNIPSDEHLDLFLESEISKGERPSSISFQELFQGNILKYFKKLLAPVTDKNDRILIIIFLSIFTINFLYLLFIYIRSIYTFIALPVSNNAIGSNSTILLITSITQLSLAILLILLIYTRRRWGWILMFAGALYSCIISGTTVNESHLYSRNAGVMIFALLLNGVIAFLLSRKALLRFYGISRTTQFITIMGCIALAVLRIIFL